MSEEMKNEDIKKFGEEQYEAINSIFTEEELRQQDVENQIEEAKMRQVLITQI